jgi:hypothetical protein
LQGAALRHIFNAMKKDRTPVVSDRDGELSPGRSSAGDVQAFLRQVRALSPAADGGGRLILALDATMSRQPTWDLACELQSEMFDAVGKAGGLNVQLVYFRGFGECRASRFVRDTESLKSLMTRIDCRSGRTQIGKVLAHAIRENARKKVNALVYIGDAMEENPDELAHRAGNLGLRGVPVFLFQEGYDPATEATYREIAKLSKGAWFRFDRSSAATLGRLLSSVAVYATGGLKALEARGSREDRLMIEHIRGSRGG